MEQAKAVSVFGSSQVQPGSPAYDEARLVGTLLAREGLTVCSGGYGGVMEAVSRGAKEAGGFVIGVTSKVFTRRGANQWVDKKVETETFIERLRTLIGLGQGYLALKGGIGTLTEISLVWSLLQTRSIPRGPFVLLRDPWEGLLGFCSDTLIIRKHDLGYPLLASTPDKAVRAIVQSLSENGS